MSDDKYRPQLNMRRPDLDDLPEIELPEGYSLRTYRPGDGANWCHVINESFGGERQLEHFDRTMKQDNAFRPERIYFIECDESVVATASAWHRPRWGRDSGTVHFVGALPGHSGKRLGYWVSLATLHQMVRDGRSWALLQTDDFRLPAIVTYLRLGFAPMLVHENQRQRWLEVFAEVGDDEAPAKFASILEGPLAEPLEQHTDRYDLSNLRVRRVWHPDRTARIKPSGGGTVDALGDESLYRPSQVGTAGIDVTEVHAAEDRPFTLWFRGGESPLESGTTVRFSMRGQRPFGGPLQLQSPDRPGYIEIEAPDGIDLETINLGFRVKDGSLREGDEVRLHIGREHGFRWTELAGKREFKVIVDVHPDEPQLRLPEPVVVHVLPLKPDHLDVFLPGTSRGEDTITATVSVRDRFDNRVSVGGSATVELGDDTHDVALTDGLGRVSLPSSSTIARARVTHPAIPDHCTSNPTLPPGNRQSPITIHQSQLTNPQSPFTKLFFGDLHCHDFLSEAEGYPDQVYTWARDDKALDFVSVAVQSHGYHENDKWTIVKHLNERFLDEGIFVTFLAFEWQHSHYGDKVVHYLGGDQPYLPVDDGRYSTPAKLYEALRGSDAFVVSHHPAYPLDMHVPGTDWSSVETDVDCLAELWSMHGSSEGYDPTDRPLRDGTQENAVVAALKSGVRVGLVAGSDTHSARPGGSAREPRPHWGGLAAVWAEELTRRDLFEAFRARRTYALTGARIVLTFTVNGHPMGAQIEGAPEARIEMEAHAPSDIATVEILRDGEVIRVAEPGAPDCRVEHEDSLGDSGTAFYHCRVTQSDGHLAVCSPVWME